jgi:phenylacetate-coenzyme A ligase PaaK-like adenylate-forming protein
MELVLQLERPLPDGSRYISLTPGELEAYALALARCWRLAGLRRGDRVIIFDFGASPLSFLASCLYSPFLRRGAAERVGCIPVCNDGVATVVPRGVQMLKVLAPKVAYVRADLMPPLATAMENASHTLQTVVAAAEEAVLPAAEAQRYRERMRTEVLRLLRLDAALFLAQECPRCRAFHIWPDLYQVWDERGALAVAPHFSPGRAYVSTLPFRRLRGPCPEGPRHFRVTLPP